MRPNLGAAARVATDAVYLTSDASPFGLYYQLGWKDPFKTLVSVATNGTAQSVGWAINNPTAFIDNNSDWCALRLIKIPKTRAEIKHSHSSCWASHL